MLLFIYFFDGSIFFLLTAQLKYRRCHRRALGRVGLCASSLAGGTVLLMLVLFTNKVLWAAMGRDMVRKINSFRSGKSQGIQFSVRKIDILRKNQGKLENWNRKIDILRKSQGKINEI